MTWGIYLLTGIGAGVFGGLFGLGGGIILVPILALFFGFSQHHAQGTTLATLVLPIGILAAYKYYHMGHVNIKVAALLAVGFFIGGYFGAKFAHQIPGPMLKKMFSIVLIVVAVKMWMEK
jgi:uncharacterized protein